MFKRGPDIKKASYYVQYIGWKEAAGLHGRQFTDPIVYDLVHRRNVEKSELSKLTLTVSKKELRIMQDPTGTSTRTKYPPIPACDVAFACTGVKQDQDIVATIFLGYNPTTRRAVHVHVYRCDSAETAKQLVDHLNQIINIPENRQRLEQLENDLLAQGEIRPSGLLNAKPVSIPVTADGFESKRSAEPAPAPATATNNRSKLGLGKKSSPKMPNQMESLTSELKEKLQGPMLFPPRDYDTVSRSHGSLLHRQTFNAAADPSSPTRVNEEPNPDYEEEIEVRRQTNRDPFLRTSTGMLMERDRAASNASRSSDGSRHSSFNRLSNSDGMANGAPAPYFRNVPEDNRRLSGLSGDRNSTKMYY